MFEVDEFNDRIDLLSKKINISKKIQLG